MKHVAMAVVVRNGNVLIQRRFRQDKGMVYEFPGGTIDEGESPEQTARRELFEEVGLQSGALLGVHEATNQWGGKIYYVVLSALAAQEPRAVDPRRRQSFYWFALRDMPLDDFYPADVQFIQEQLGEHLKESF